jgi:DNA-binding response OmpR family regulator
VAGGGRRTRPMAAPGWELGGVTVLVADEDAAVRAEVQRALPPEVTVVSCGDGAEAVWHAGRTDPAVVVLSATLPVLPAADVAAVLVRHRTDPAPIAVAVGPGEADLAGAVVAAGATTVVSRPCRRGEMEPLLGVHLAQRAQHAQSTAVLDVGVLHLDAPAFVVTAAGRHIRLKLREFELLRLLMMHSGLVVTQQYVREQLWDARGKTVSANTIAVHVRRLRAHLAGVADIRAVRGLGYRLVVPEEPPVRSPVGHRMVGVIEDAEGRTSSDLWPGVERSTG